MTNVQRRMGHLRYIECVSCVALTTVFLSRQHVTQPIDRDNSFPSSNSFGPNNDPDCTPNRRYDPRLELYQEYRLGSGERWPPFSLHLASNLHVRFHERRINFVDVFLNSNFKSKERRPRNTFSPVVDLEYYVAQSFEKGFLPSQLLHCVL